MGTYAELSFDLSIDAANLGAFRELSWHWNDDGRVQTWEQLAEAIVNAYGEDGDVEVVVENDEAGSPATVHLDGWTSGKVSYSWTESIEQALCAAKATGEIRGTWDGEECLTRFKGGTRRGFGGVTVFPEDLDDDTIERLADERANKRAEL